MTDIPTDLDSYTFAVRYDSLADPDVDPTSADAVFSPVVAPAESLVEAADWRGQFEKINAGNPNVKNFEVVYTPKVTWNRWPDEALQTSGRTQEDPRETT